MSATDTPFILTRTVDAPCEITNSRSFAAPIARVWQAWTDAQQLATWWGPKGFTNTFHQFDHRVGGSWKFTMHGPDGTDYENEWLFVEILEHQRMVIEHVSNPKFRLVAVFTDHGEKTGIVWRQIFETAKVCEALKPICEPANEENFDRLEAIVTAKA